jgi:hypothetical protein
MSFMYWREPGDFDEHVLEARFVIPGGAQVRFYTYDTVKDPLVMRVETIDSYKYVTEDIADDNFTADFIEKMLLHTGILIDRIWYEGDKLTADLNGPAAWVFDNGSTGGQIHCNMLLFTLSSLPGVRKIEILVDGVSGVEGHHFNFTPIFDVIVP